MRFNKQIIRIVCLILVFCSVICCTSITAFSDEMSDLQRRRTELENEQKRIQSQINAIKNDKSKQQQYKNSLQQQINNTLAQINVYNASIAAVEAKIAEADADIARKDAEMAALKEEFRKRVRDIVLSGGTVSGTLLSTLVGGDEFADLLTVSEYTKNMSAYDANMMEDIEREMANIRKLKTELEAKRAEQVTFKETLTDKQKNLASQVNEINRVILSLGGKEQDLSDQYSELKKKEQQVEKQIQELASHGTGTAFTGSFRWPLPGSKSSYTLTSRIDMNRIHPVYGYVSAHTGNDYWRGDIYGQPIYAAAAGTVTIAGNDVGGFGYYVMINHGKYNGAEYATLYAHMTRFVVSNKQKVNQGQLIGYVGFSGAATGPHLHLEVRVNGVPKDSELYFR